MPEAGVSAPAGGDGGSGAATGEPDGTSFAAAAATDVPRAAVDGPGGPAETAGPTAPAEHRLFYGLGVGVQTLLWFLLFLAIVVAVAVGGELTEFRYVGF